MFCNKSHEITTPPFFSIIKWPENGIAPGFHSYKTYQRCNVLWGLIWTHTLEVKWPKLKGSLSWSCKLSCWKWCFILIKYHVKLVSVLNHCRKDKYYFSWFKCLNWYSVNDWARKDWLNFKMYIIYRSHIFCIQSRGLENRSFKASIKFWWRCNLYGCPHQTQLFQGVEYSQAA